MLLKQCALQCQTCILLVCIYYEKCCTDLCDVLVSAQANNDMRSTVSSIRSGRCLRMLRVPIASR